MRAVVVGLGVAFCDRARALIKVLAAEDYVVLRHELDSGHCIPRCSRMRELDEIKRTRDLGTVLVYMCVVIIWDKCRAAPMCQTLAIIGRSRHPSWAGG